jgi:hypothetical protein
LNCKTFELMNTNNLSVHVPDDDIYTEIRKKKLTKKTKVWNDFLDSYELFDFLLFSIRTAS